MRLKFLLISSLMIFLPEYIVATGLYLNEFVVEANGGPETAKRIARELGFEYRGLIDALPDHYVLSHREVPHRHKREADHSTRLSSHPEIRWAEQQIELTRVKRNGDIEKERRHLENEAYKRIPSSFNDPLWVSHSEDWYLVDSEQTPENISYSIKTDLGVLPVWEKGYMGKGVVVTILDDGLEWNHTDLADNYAPWASRDVNDNDDDPFPRYDWTNENKHGTRCAGVISMVANNSFCGVGIAPLAKIGAVRILDGTINDRVEAESIGFNVRNIDMMSASWGPSDNGRQCDGPGTLTTKALNKGITEGRRGLGTVYIWASGNGGSKGDNCACDGYASHPYTVSISVVSSGMESPYYIEDCPSTIASTFSSGGYSEGQITSTDLHNQCTTGFTGTSAAAPQAAALVALMLEARPDLTWRDVQHIIVWTAHPYALYNNEGWRTNAAGFKVHHRFGFGLMSGIDMVEAAEDWTLVGPRLACEFEATSLPKSLQGSEAVGVDINVPDSCAVNYLEHLQLVVTIPYSKRGCLSLNLTSPSGTTVSMMRPRENDQNTVGYSNWPFSSLQTWGENPHGLWRAVIYDDACTEHSGQVKAVKLKFWGTSEMPKARMEEPHHVRPYHFLLQEAAQNKHVDTGGTDFFSDFASSIGKAWQG